MVVVDDGEGKDCRLIVLHWYAFEEAIRIEKRAFPLNPVELCDAVLLLFHDEKYRDIDCIVFSGS
jgi:hypothetical protein